MLYKNSSFELGNLSDDSSKNKQVYINMHMLQYTVQPVKESKLLVKRLVHAKTHIFKLFFENLGIPTYLVITT